MKPDEIKQEIAESLPVGEEIQQFIPEVRCNDELYDIALTANRIVLRKRGFWRKSSEDYLATRISRVSLEEGWFNSSVSVELKDGEKITFDRLKKDGARRLCGFIRTMISAVEVGPNTVKICPDCGAQLKMAAKICPYCEYKFSTKADPPYK